MRQLSQLLKACQGRWGILNKSGRMPDNMSQNSRSGTSTSTVMSLFGSLRRRCCWVTLIEVKGGMLPMKFDLTQPWTDNDIKWMLQSLAQEEEQWHSLCHLLHNNCNRCHCGGQQCVERWWHGQEDGRRRQHNKR